MPCGVVRIGRRLDGKALLRQFLRDPFTDQDLVFHDQDADRTLCFVVLFQFHGRSNALST